MATAARFEVASRSRRGRRAVALRRGLALGRGLGKRCAVQNAGGAATVARAGADDQRVRWLDAAVRDHAPRSRARRGAEAPPHTSPGKAASRAGRAEGFWHRQLELRGPVACAEEGRRVGRRVAAGSAIGAFQLQRFTTKGCGGACCLVLLASRSDG